ncbi:DUF6415 family natural product biosynthesis protein [Streptomyces scopuliridis]
MSIESQARVDTETSESKRCTAVRQSEELSPTGVATTEPNATSNAGSAGIDQSPSTQAYAVDLTTISHTVKQALELRISLPEREWTDTTTLKLRGHLATLIDDEIWDVETAQSRALLNEARELLGDEARPTETTPPGFAYEYMRSLALVTRTAAAVYRLRHVDRDRKRRAMESNR